MITYLTRNYIFLIMLIGMTIILWQSTDLDRDIVKAMRLTLALVFVLSVSDAIERYYGQLDYPTFARVFWSFLGYNLRICAAAAMLIMMLPKKKVFQLLWLPAALNLVIYGTAFFSPWAFSFGPDNGFRRGPGGYSCYIIGAVYILLLLIHSIKTMAAKNLRQGFCFFFCAMTIVGAMIFEAFSDSGLLNLSTVTACTFYYMFLHVNATRIDHVTGMPNRRAYYVDTEIKARMVNVIESIDMNGLKRLNDTKGHLAGDAGLKAVSECIMKSLSKNMAAYRMGGDEFLVMGLGIEEEAAKQQIEDLKAALAETEYSCSVGYAMREDGDTIEDMIRRADQKMYEDKHRYYLSSGIDRRKR